MPSKERKIMPIVLGYLARLIGYAMPLIAAWVTTKHGPELGAAVGTVGAAILHGTQPTVLPKPKGE